MILIFESQPPPPRNKAFSNQNKGHLSHEKKNLLLSIILVV